MTELPSRILHLQSSPCFSFAVDNRYTWVITCYLGVERRNGGLDHNSDQRQIEDQQPCVVKQTQGTNTTKVKQLGLCPLGPLGPAL